MTQVVVDTNAFLRFFLDDIPSQKKEFEKILLQAKKSNNPLTVPNIVIFELNYILNKYYKIEKTEIINKLKGIISSSYFRIETPDLLIETLKVYTNNNISLADSYILVFAKTKNAKIFTFDKNLQKLAAI